MERKPTNISVAQAFDRPNAPKELKIPGYSYPGNRTPKSNPEYIFGPALSTVLAWFMAGGKDGLFITGPKGCGKTDLVREICSRTNTNLYETNAYYGMELAELIGHHTIIGGDTIWQDGPLSQAMDEGAPFMINEIDLMDPGTITGLNPVLEGHALSQDDNGGAIVHPQPGFKFIATGNTNGGGDSTGIFCGTERQNAAFMDRFWVIHMDYLPVEQETDLLIKNYQVHPKLAEQMAVLAKQTRDLHLGNGSDFDVPAQIEVPMSTRSLTRWAHIAQTLNGKDAGVEAFKQGLSIAYANRLEHETYTAVHELLQRIMDTATLTGKSQAA